MIRPLFEGQTGGLGASVPPSATTDVSGSPASMRQWNGSGFPLSE